MPDQSALLMFVGTYTRPEPHVRGTAEGIYVYQLDPASGALSHLSTATGVINPSFLALDHRGRNLYAVQEVGDDDGGGAVNAFRIDAAAGSLTAINQQASHGAAPCHISVDAADAWALVANYGGGNASALPIQADGGLGPAAATVGGQLAGDSRKGHDPARQDAPHAHGIFPSPDNRFALVADLGLDAIYVYRIDPDAGVLAEHAVTRLHPGAGPRKLAFHPRGHRLYCANELDSTLTVFAYDAAAGSLETLQTISTRPADYAGDNHGADVHVAPSGRFVYASNRGHDSLAIFAVDEAAGTLASLGHAPTGGRTPRAFAITPDGGLLVAANQDGNTVTVFRVDETSGGLAALGAPVPVASPVCIAFLARD